MIESEIIQHLNGDALSRDKALTYLYSSKTYRDAIVHFLLAKGVSKDDSNMLWTDIVVKFSTLVSRGKYEDQQKLIGYLKNLANYMLLNHFRDQKRDKTEDLSDLIIKDHYIEAVTMDHKELKGLFDEQLGRIGEVCKSILSLWSQDYSMNDIMDKLSLISVEATRKRKHLCMKQLLDNISGNQDLLNLLQEYYKEQ